MFVLNRLVHADPESVSSYHQLYPGWSLYDVWVFWGVTQMPSQLGLKTALLLSQHETWSRVLSSPLPSLTLSLLPRTALVAGGPDHTASLIVEIPPCSYSLTPKSVCMVLVALSVCSTRHAHTRSVSGLLCIPSLDACFTVRRWSRSDSSCTQ